MGNCPQSHQLNDFFQSRSRFSHILMKGAEAHNMGGAMVGAVDQAKGLIEKLSHARHADGEAVAAITSQHVFVAIAFSVVLVFIILAIVLRDVKDLMTTIEKVETEAKAEAEEVPQISTLRRLFGRPTTSERGSQMSFPLVSGAHVTPNPAPVVEPDPAPVVVPDEASLVVPDAAPTALAQCTTAELQQRCLLAEELAHSLEDEVGRLQATLAEWLDAFDTQAFELACLQSTVTSSIRTIDVLNARIDLKSSYAMEIETETTPVALISTPVSTSATSVTGSSCEDDADDAVRAVDLHRALAPWSASLRYDASQPVALPASSPETTPQPPHDQRRPSFCGTISDPPSFSKIFDAVIAEDDLSRRPTAEAGNQTHVDLRAAISTYKKELGARDTPETPETPETPNTPETPVASEPDDVFFDAHDTHELPNPVLSKPEASQPEEPVQLTPPPSADLITPPKRRRRPQADTGKAAVTLVVPTPPKRRRNSKGVAAVDAEAGSRESLDKEHVRVVELAWLAEAEGSLVVPDRAAADDKENDVGVVESLPAVDLTPAEDFVVPSPPPSMAPTPPPRLIRPRKVATA